MTTEDDRQKHADYMRDYYHRPEVKPKMQARMAEYNRRPETLAKRRERYRNDPIHREKILVMARAYGQRPEVKAARHEYLQRPDRQARRREYEQRPEVIERRRAHRREHGRRNWMKQRYGMALEDYDRMLHEQGDGCAICHQPPPGKRSTLFIDHDHATGKVRGLLCDACNRLLGDAHDDPVRLKAAIKYLRRG